MSNLELFRILRQLRLLDNVSDDHVRLLAAISRCIDLPEGKTIFREGEAADSVYLVVNGRIGLEICAPGIGCKRILTVQGGEILGWSALLGIEQLTATARTLAALRVVRVAGDEIRTLCDEHPRFGFEFMRCAALALGKRLNATRLQLLNLYAVDSQDRHSRSENEGAS